MVAFLAPTPSSQLVGNTKILPQMSLNNFKEQPKKRVAFETFDQSDEET